MFQKSPLLTSFLSPLSFMSSRLVFESLEVDLVHFLKSHFDWFDEATLTFIQPLGSSKGKRNFMAQFSTREIALKILNSGDPRIRTPKDETRPSENTGYPLSDRLSSNAVLSQQFQKSKEIASRPTLVVVLLNAILPEPLSESEQDALREELASLGKWKIDEIRVFPTLGKIFVKFADLHSSMNFQYKLNGARFDDERTVVAGFFPLDRFLAGKYSILD